MTKTTDKEIAVKMRKAGSTYSEILKIVPVAKSTLSLWLRDVGLAIPQIQRLTVKKLEASRKGGAARRLQRINLIDQIFRKTKEEITNISKRELWLLGIVLYWAEGTKEKEIHPGSGINFNNSDPRMIKIFVKWLLKSCKIPGSRIKFEIYIHENSKNNQHVVVKHWSKVTGFDISKFNKIYFKQNVIKTKRINTGALYFGLLRVRVSASSELLRHVAGWTEAIAQCLN